MDGIPHGPDEQHKGKQGLGGWSLAEAGLGPSSQLSVQWCQLIFKAPISLCFLSRPYVL